MTFPTFLLLFPIIILVVYLSLKWTQDRSASILQRWADANGYQLKSQEYCWFFRGPYFWRSSKNQSVFYVKVRDADGQVRTGWVRVGGWVFGIFSDQVDVTWE